MAKLRDEINEFAGKDIELSYDLLQQMNYLHNVLRESAWLHWLCVHQSLYACLALRLYPSVPLNTRTAVRNTSLPTGGGPDRQSPVFIPAGTAVAFCPYVMHRRLDLFGPDAEDFRPERWQEDAFPAQQYIPFNSGPRTCLGSECLCSCVKQHQLICISTENFAMTLASYAVIHLLREFPNITPAKASPSEKIGDEVQSLSLVLSLKNGLKVRVSDHTWSQSPRSTFAGLIKHAGSSYPCTEPW